MYGPYLTPRNRDRVEQRNVPTRTFQQIHIASSLWKFWCFIQALTSTGCGTLSPSLCRVWDSASVDDPSVVPGSLLCSEPRPVVGVLWRRHMKSLITTFLIGNRGRQLQPLFLWFAERTKQHIRCLEAPSYVRFYF